MKEHNPRAVSKRSSLTKKSSWIQSIDLCCCCCCCCCCHYSLSLFGNAVRSSDYYRLFRLLLIRRTLPTTVTNLAQNFKKMAETRRLPWPLCLSNVFFSKTNEKFIQSRNYVNYFHVRVKQFLCQGNGFLLLSSFHSLFSLYKWNLLPRWKMFLFDFLRSFPDIKFLCGVNEVFSQSQLLDSRILALVDSCLFIELSWIFFPLSFSGYFTNPFQIQFQWSHSRENIRFAWSVYDYLSRKRIGSYLNLLTF